jgi:hypothetical protein
MRTPFMNMELGSSRKVNHRDEKSDNTKVQFVNPECQDTRELLKDRFGENDNHNYPGLPSTPTRGISGLHLSSSEKRLYNWQEEKASDDCFKLPRGKSRDPFEEKDTQAFDKAILDSYLKPVNSRPPLHSRSPPREALPASFNDKSKLDIKDGYQDKMYFTERDHRKEYRSKDSDLGHQSTSREHDFATLMGKCKRLESENQILLKNNSELRKENLEMREKLAHSEPMKELENKLRELNEINKKLELQLMSQASSPVLASNSSYHQSRPFFNQNSLSRERLNRSGGSSDRPHKHFESSKHFSQTERLNGANSKAMSTKVKFADSVLGMLRQLVDLNKGDEEFKQAWKLLKNVIGEYVELKREARSGPRSPLLKKDLSTNSENFRMKSPDVVRQRSAERNKWRDRNKAAELGF